MTSARSWVQQLEADTLFRADDVPGKPEPRTELLHKLSRGSEPLLERVSSGIYWKRLRPNAYCTIGASTRCLSQALGWIAGPGGGLAGSTALRAFGWTTQIPAVYRITALRTEPVDSSITHLRWEYSSAKHRLNLTWEEVSLIEAVKQWLGSDDFSWEYILMCLSLDIRVGRMPTHMTLRPDAIEAVIDREEPRHLEQKLRSLGPISLAPLDERLADVCAALRARPSDR